MLFVSHSWMKWGKWSRVPKQHSQRFIGTELNINVHIYLLFDKVTKDTAFLFCHLRLINISIHMKSWSTLVAKLLRHISKGFSIKDLLVWERSTRHVQKLFPPTFNVKTFIYDIAPHPERWFFEDLHQDVFKGNSKCAQDAFDGEQQMQSRCSGQIADVKVSCQVQ